MKEEEAAVVTVVAVAAGAAVVGVAALIAAVVELVASAESGIVWIGSQMTLVPKLRRRSAAQQRSALPSLKLNQRHLQ